MTTNTKHVEQRRRHRVTIPEHPLIFDAHSGKVFGQLVNLSADGLMVAGDRCIEHGSVCQLRIPLMREQRVVEVRVGAESLWCEDAHGSGVFWTGYHIIDISPEDQQTLDDIVGG